MRGEWREQTGLSGVGLVRVGKNKTGQSPQKIITPGSQEAHEALEFSQEAREAKKYSGKILSTEQFC